MSGNITHKVPWKQAATLMLGKNLPATPKPNFTWKVDKRLQLLYVKRVSKQSDIFSENLVFPGGTLDSADHSPLWWSLFKNCAEFFGETNARKFLSDSLTTKSRLPMYSTEAKLLAHDSLPISTSFRICAIRETFEETGLLLCVNFDQLKNLNIKIRNRHAVQASLFPPPGREKWRSIVHDDANQFLELCTQMNCVPDVWSLNEWSNWLSPYVIKKRFDTVFFVTTIDHSDDIIADMVEISQAGWFAPQEVIRRKLEGSIMLPVPTTYESLRLCRFDTAEALHRFAAWREENHPTNRVCKELLMYGDKIIATVFSESSIYSKLKKDDIEGGGVNSAPDIALSEIIDSAPLNLAILDREDTNKYHILCNATPNDGHQIPSPISLNKVKSKL